MIRIISGVLIMLGAIAVSLWAVGVGLHLADTFPRPLKFSQSMGVGGVIFMGLAFASALTIPAVKLTISGIERRKARKNG